MNLPVYVVTVQIEHWDEPAPRKAGVTSTAVERWVLIETFTPDLDAARDSADAVRTGARSLGKLDELRTLIEEIRSENA